MPYKKILALVLIVGLSIVLLGVGFYSGFEFGKSTPEVLIVKGVTDLESPAKINVDFGMFWNVWKIIDDEYLRATNDTNQDRVYGAMKGMVQSLGDPHTAFLTPQSSQKFSEDIQGSFGGVGIEIGIRKDRLVVIAPLKGTPAFQAGIKSGDTILEINSSSTGDMTVDDAVRLIRGPENTVVTLTILRSDWDESREFKITRARIEVPTLDFVIKEGDIGYLQLYSFNTNSRYRFHDAIQTLQAKGGKGLVLDLRDNPGGFLEVAIDLAGWFLKRGDVIVSEAYRGEEKQDFLATGSGALSDLPVVILLNQGSASASEILAGALKANRGIKIVGERSFGKGTVQEVKRFSDGSSLKITVAHWVLPDGEVIEGKGLTPDFEVKLPEGIDKGSEGDLQLNKALELLKNENHSP